MSFILLKMPRTALTATSRKFLSFQNYQTRYFSSQQISAASVKNQSQPQQQTLQNPDESLKNHHECTMPHPVWNEKEVKKVDITHLQPANIGDKFANLLIQSLRFSFDVMSGYKKVFPWQKDVLTEKDWLNRMLFLETVAGVPGFVAAMHRHLRSLRTMKRDNGWIHTLLEEAENERMHLLTFMQVQKPSMLFRTGVVLAQQAYVLLFSFLYFFYPRISHRVVGYLEEEAVKTYSHAIEVASKQGNEISHWATKKAPKIAIEYWQLSPEASLLDAIYAIRKDEEHHRDVNHEFADDYSQQKKNPFPPGH